MKKDKHKENAGSTGSAGCAGTTGVSDPGLNGVCLGGDTNPTTTYYLNVSPFKTRTVTVLKYKVKKNGKEVLVGKKVKTITEQDFSVPSYPCTLTQSSGNEYAYTTTVSQPNGPGQ